jgi:hypothetical protein
LHASGGVRRHLVEEVVGGAALAREPSLHVGERDEHGVDRPVLDQGGELLQREHSPARWHQCQSSSGVRACRSSTPNSLLSNSATARSYFSIPHAQKSKSMGLLPSWMDAQSVQPYFATSPEQPGAGDLDRARDARSRP